jgi:hypothetical protein
MAWLSNNKNQLSQAAALPDPGKHTFDVPIKIALRGMAEPVQASLLHIALAGCRLRSWMLMERGTAISFDWRLSDGKKLTLNGVIAARYAPRNGGVGFEYAVALERIPAPEADALAREAAMLERKSASARAYDTSLVDISQFTGYRVPDDFAITYRIDDPRAGSRVAQACDVTGNALRMRCREKLRPGQILSLQFRLPERVLDIHKGKDDELVVGPHGYRRVPRKHLRRPFEELHLRGRVAAIVKDTQAREACEIELLDVSGLAREEIARYIHASQLARIRR